ncbi:MFS transporter [Oceaniglobus indicus]|uniref:MFS transporter n=1 Tax=Oceaniglobus indicus TaxID=2047749 RepID=UPI001F4E92BF|nr:MFS transporter [Oceaniglobus indicus]
MPDFRGPRGGVTAMFILNGALFGIWASRIPAFVDHFALTSDQLGLLLLCLGGGAIVSFPLAGRASDRRGAAGVTRVIALAYAVSLAALALSPNLPVLALALLAFGAAHGAMDVTMNAWGAEVERRMARPILPVFHAMWSLGAGLGAASGFAAVRLGVPVGPHFLVLGALVTAVALWFARIDWKSDRSDAPGSVFAIPKGRLALVGLIAMSAALCEGAMADWSAVFLDSVKGIDEARAALGYVAFSAAMVGVRLSGAATVAWLGTTLSARLSGVCVFLGVVTVLLAPALAIALAGFALIGAGAALIMPLAFSRAAADPLIRPGRAIASVATLGYGGMLMGPPLIGFLADATTLSFAFAVLAVFGVAIVALAPCLVIPAKGDLDPDGALR